MAGFGSYPQKGKTGKWAKSLYGLGMTPARILNSPRGVAHSLTCEHETPSVLKYLSYLSLSKAS